MTFVRDAAVHVDESGMPQRVTVGPYDLDAEHISDGAVAVCITPGAETPMYRLWLPLNVEGTVTDPSGCLRIVHEADEQYLVGGPPQPTVSRTDLDAMARRLHRNTGQIGAGEYWDEVEGARKDMWRTYAKELLHEAGVRVS